MALDLLRHRPAVREGPASARFRFRFIARGERANALVVLAVKSLTRCHPHVAIVVIDANDVPTLAADQFAIDGDLAIIHLPPGDDEVAQAVGRGTGQHLFYWRHAPHVLRMLPPSDRYAVFADADIVFLRPMDLASLVAPLAHGRIAATVDESMLAYYGRLATLAAAPVASMLPIAGAGGPLLQGGLLFTNPADDGGFYDQFWQFAVRAARAGLLAHLPWDDMCIVTTLLGRGGPLWQRLLPLGHEWNYISDALKDPGIFGCGAHFGGERAKALILAERDRLFPSGFDADRTSPWGTVVRPGDVPCLRRGPWRIRAAPEQYACGTPHPRPLAIPMPFCLTWLVPAGAPMLRIAAARGGHDVPSDATLLIYLDGRLEERVTLACGPDARVIGCAGAETVTIIGVTRADVGAIHLEDPFDGVRAGRGDVRETVERAALGAAERREEEGAWTPR